ncbi:50S ribosomal protein L20 [Candidatus Vidania fulgoroideorum]
MSRVKSCSVNRNKHKKILKKTKGFFGRRKSCFKIAKQAFIRSLMYSYRDRKRKKSIIKKNNLSNFIYFLKENNIKYSNFLKKKKDKNIILNSKSLYYISNLCYKNENFKFLFLNIIR